MKSFFLILTVVLLYSSPIAAQFVRLPEAVPDRPIITVSGQAQVLIPPDQVVFRLKSEHVDRDLNRAKTKTDDEIKKTLALAKDYKIEPQNIQTSYIRISEHYSQPTQTRTRIFDGYSVIQSTTILLTDISRFDRFFADLVKAGISDVGDVTFRASQMRKHMDEARTMAMRAAREKAVSLASEVHQGIGKAISITELGISVSASHEDEDSETSNNSNNVSIDFDPKSASDNQPLAAPGMISIVARVRVTFELN